MLPFQFILANFNSIEHVEVLIKSLRTFPPGSEYQILAVDNGSTDGSKEYLQSLPEVKLWEYTDLPEETELNERLYSGVRYYELERYMHPFFLKKTIDKDHRRTHAAALNFLMGKVESPLFATLDTDMEFLSPVWFGPFLTPFLLNQDVTAVGTDEQAISFKIGGYTGFTVPRLHPCLAFWRTEFMQENAFPYLWNHDDIFELRMPMIHKSLEEKLTYDHDIQLGDVGHRAAKTINQEGKIVVNLPDESYFRSVRHFYGATVGNEKHSPEFKDWLCGIANKPHLKPLYDYAVQTYAYTEYGREILQNVRAYWQTKNPELPQPSKLPIMMV